MIPNDLLLINVQDLEKFSNVLQQAGLNSGVISWDSGDLPDLPLPPPSPAKAADEIKQQTEDISWESGDLPNLLLPGPSSAGLNKEACEEVKKES